MNIYDISEKAGVSIATVSRVLNGSPNVSDKTRAKVLAVINESGFTPNVFARGLGLNTMKTVGIMCADSSDSYLAKAVYYIEHDLRRNNYDSILCCTGYGLETKQKRLNLLLSKRVDGIILIGSNYVEAIDKNNDYIREAAQTVPLVIVNGVLSAANIYSTVCDDYNAMFELTERYIHSGKKNILYLYNSHSYSGMQKLSGFRAALKKNSVNIKEDHICFLKTQSATANMIRDNVAEFAKKGITFDGVIASDDITAVGALKYAKSAEMKIPQEAFISGYNNSDLTECCEPELTSVDNKPEIICHQSVATLMGVFEGKAMPKKTIFSAEIIERETTKFI